MEVLVVAAHDAVLVDQLRAIVLQAIQASGTSHEITNALQDPREHPLSDQQILLWRDRCSPTSLASLLSDPFAQTLHSSASSDSVANNSPTETDATATASLVKRIHKRDRKIKSLSHTIDDLRTQLADATSRTSRIEQEQEHFFEAVQHMKVAYDKLHASHQKLLWEYLPAKDPTMRAIPILSHTFKESETSIGPYTLSDVLGYGQYATVFASHAPGNPQDLLAVKAIDKEKLLDLITLHRVNSEIASLQDPAIHHAGILGLREVFHTPRHIYLVTDRGGKDLFDYFGPHDDGVPEGTIHKLLLRVALAVETLHRHEYCHRDLKPENILYDPDHASPSHTVKVVDFGLCTKAPDGLLDDFCGSPGFFAPEILLRDRYDGRKADVWSLGCILLELVLGNNRFATMWMAMYELETLRNHAKFSTLLHSSLEATRQFCRSNAWTYSPALRSLLLSMLCESPQERPSITQILDHAWFRVGSSSSPSRCATTKPVMLPACVSLSEGCLPLHTNALPGSSPHRPASADHESTAQYSAPHISVLLAATSVEPAGSSPSSPPSSRPATPKLLLPSLSPEKPTGARSPDRTFAKRMPTLATASTTTTTTTTTATSGISSNPPSHSHS